MAKSRRNKSGQFRRSYREAFRPLFWLSIGLLLLGFIWNYNQEQQLIGPCDDGCSFFMVRAYEETIIEIKSIKNIKPKVAKITAYSCIGIKDEYHLMMNCPSIKHYGEPRTANGTAPIIDKTMACDKANMGKTFEIEGIGRRTCTDTGGAIKGAGRFDLYVSDIQTAYAWGTRELEYKEVK